MSLETIEPLDEQTSGSKDLKEVVGSLEYDYSNSPLGPDQKKFNEYNRRIAGSGEPLTDEERAEYQELNRKYQANINKNLKKAEDIYDQSSREGLN